MEHLPYIDEHATTVDASQDATWVALLRLCKRSLGTSPPRWMTGPYGLQPAVASGEWTPALAPGAALPGFAVAEARTGELLSLRGRHRFSSYRLDLVLEPAGTGQTLVRAHTWAEFPGLAGSVYRALVIGSGGHRLVVRGLLRRLRNSV